MAELSKAEILSMDEIVEAVRNSGIQEPLRQQIETLCIDIYAAGRVAEREECAKVCESEAKLWPPSKDFALCAAAIRARVVKP